MKNSLSSLSQLIKQLESSLLDISVRQSPEKITLLIADDFLEFGSSGTIYNKQHCLEPDATPRIIAMSDFSLKELSQDVVLATYKTIENNVVSLRSSMWQRYGEEWKMIFHQGTQVPKTPIRSQEKAKNNIELIPAKLADYPAIQNMARFYIYDRSRFMGWDCPENGLYECIDFKHYFESTDEKAYLIRVDDELAGFVLLDKIRLLEKVDWNMGEFFVLAKFQGKNMVVSQKAGLADKVA